MRRWIRIVLAGVLVTAGCADAPAKQPPPRVYSIMYGVRVGPEPIGYLVYYTADNGVVQHTTGQPGKGWAGQAKVTYTRGGSVQLRVMVNPVVQPDLTVLRPQVQCRIDIDGVLGDVHDEVDSDGCEVEVDFAEFNTRSTFSPEPETRS